MALKVLVILYEWKSSISYLVNTEARYSIHFTCHWLFWMLPSCIFLCVVHSARLRYAWYTFSSSSSSYRQAYAETYKQKRFCCDFTKNEKKKEKCSTPSQRKPTKSKTIETKVSYCASSWGHICVHLRWRQWQWQWQWQWQRRSHSPFTIYTLNFIWWLFVNHNSAIRKYSPEGDIDTHQWISLVRVVY